MRRVALAAVVLLAGGAAPPPGASSCTGCHDSSHAMGVLQGRPAGEIAADMEAFRSGARPATVMGRIAKGFTPDEVRRLAAWFAAK